ncbi:hypothetical protein DN730_03855 [Marinomonas piezotolerans]|uniref:Uncharacterized protein n=1 Tax=Marinomonas piezotolerans TaxID=2213058 RepID=A0A370UEK7_9GAMM|nr:hypothetical protein [Marinomonas piezotolerans]RDL46181.1 hypothetical protein DN730_03855 [Marinomonas piezotolerans]
MRILKSLKAYGDKLNDSSTATSAYAGMLLWGGYLTLFIGANIFNVAVVLYAGLGLFRVYTPTSGLSKLVGKIGFIGNAFLVLVLGFLLAALEINNALAIVGALFVAMVLGLISKLFVSFVPSSTATGATLWGVIALFLTPILGIFCPFSFAIALYWMRVASQEKSYGKLHPNYAKNKARMRSEEWSHYKATPNVSVSSKRNVGNVAEKQGNTSTPDQSNPYVNVFNEFTFDYNKRS